MTDNLKVAFSDPHQGWITLTISRGYQTVAFEASYTPQDSVLHLTFALHELLFTPNDVKVIWNTEPIEYEFRFDAEGDLVHFELHEFPDHRRIHGSSHLLLAASGGYDDVCRPFWWALRALQGRVPEQEYQDRMRLPFPSAELDKLTRAIEAQSASKL